MNEGLIFRNKNRTQRERESERERERERERESERESEGDQFVSWFYDRQFTVIISLFQRFVVRA